VLCQSQLTNYLDVTDNTTTLANGNHMITRLLAPGAQTFANSVTGQAGPIFVQLEESDTYASFAGLQKVLPPFFLQGNVEQSLDDPGDVDDNASLWYWLKTYLTSYYETDIETQRYKNDAAVPVALRGQLVPADHRIPPSREWYLGPKLQRKDMFLSVRGNAPGIAALGLVPDNILNDTIVMVPTEIRYYTKDCLNFGWYVGGLVGGDEVFENGILTSLAPAQSLRFYTVGDTYVDKAAGLFGIKDAEIGTFFDQEQSIHGAATPSVHVTDVRIVPYQNGRADAHQNAWAFGNAFECVHHTTADDYPTNVASRFPVMFRVHQGELYISNLHFAFSENRTFFIATNKVGTAAAPDATQSGFYFFTKNCRTVIQNSNQAGAPPAVGHSVCTVVSRIHASDGTVIDATRFTRAALTQNGEDTLAMVHLGKNFQDTFHGDPDDEKSAVSIFDDLIAESNVKGPVFQSKRRISQHLCAPILNPNMRIGCTAPLNFETGHLPPELRDFRLELRDIDFSFLPGKVSLENLVLYEFNGGNQVVNTENKLLSLPQFRSAVSSVKLDGSFEFEVFSPYGMPSYIALFCRDTDRSRDHLSHPLIKQLSIKCVTTQKKSNTVLEANVHQLYHITQRNVNQRARYNRAVFNRRQVVLMSAEDIGMMGLTPDEYQLSKRAVFEFKGSVDQLGNVTALLIFNNRGLFVQGKQISVVRLKDQ